MIKSYFDFINESLEMSELMSEVINALAKKGNIIANILSKSDNYDTDNEINYIDTPPNPQMISYLPFKKRPEGYIGRLGNWETEYEKKGRVEAKVGRAVRKILTDLMSDVQVPKNNISLSYKGPAKFTKDSIFLPKKALDVKEDSDLVDILTTNPLVKVNYTLTAEIKKKKLTYTGTHGKFDINFPGYRHSELKGTKSMIELYFEDVVENAEDEDNYTKVIYFFDDGTRVKKEEDDVINCWLDIKITCSTGILDSDIEKFVNEYVAAMKTIRGGSKSKIEEVKGEVIKDIYSGKGHAFADVGQLGGSCMVGKDSSYFELYTKNPEVVSLLVLKGGDDTILGRALLWKLSDGNKFMDRVYSLSDSDTVVFENYAIKNNYYYRNNGSNDKIVIYKNGKKTNKKLVVDLKITKFKHYPYVDTLCYFSETYGTLNNQPKDSSGKYTYEKELRDINGGFSLPFEKPSYQYFDEDTGYF